MQCQLRPEAVLKIAKEIVPAMLVQLDGLKDSYQSNDSTTLYTDFKSVKNEDTGYSVHTVHML